MGRGFESHRGHQKESQMTCNEPFGFFIMSYPELGLILNGSPDKRWGSDVVEDHSKANGLDLMQPHGAQAVGLVWRGESGYQRVGLE